MRFEKIGFREFTKDLLDQGYEVGINEMLQAYDSIKMPERQTEGSAGYDFRTPLEFKIEPGESVIVPTGIRAVFNDDEIGTWCLQLFVRSSVGHKDGVVISHGTGIIDSDYQFAQNSGDILMALRNVSDRQAWFKRGARICQGVFLIHGIAENDAAAGKREGGMGSTGKE